MTVSLVYVGSTAQGGERIHAMYSQSVQWPTATYQATTTGDGAGTKTFTLSALWSRVYLAQSTNIGDSALDALELLSLVQTALGAAEWEIELRTDGYVQITYLGTGTGGITWGTSQPVADVLGFTASTVSLAADATLVAPYPPMGVVYSVSLDSTDWTSTPTDTAYAMSAEGIVYGWQGGYELVTKTVTLGHHPRTWADRSSLGSPYTPMWPADSLYARRRTAASLFNLAQPYTVAEFLRTARATPIAAVFSQFERFGLGSVYEIGYQTPASIELARAISPPIANYRQRSQRQGFELSLHRSYELA